MTETRRKPLLGMTLGELEAVARETGMPSFAGAQMARWLYKSHVSSTDEMTNISKANRERLAEGFCVGAMAPAERMASSDGTAKYLFPTASGRYVETVFIPDGERATLCVSSQVGCRMGCAFCQTGRQGFEGNLTAADILNQVYSLPERERLTNIVFMGQGEPLDNIDSVMKATAALTASHGYAWSPKRITVSTVGADINALRRFLNESQCHLAVSMHSPMHLQRQSLVPAERKTPIADIIALLRQYDFTGQRRVSFEYTVFAGLNDTPQHAREIARLTRGIECRVNLISYHPIAAAPLPATDRGRMEALRDSLAAHGITATIRASRGQDILAACGLLSTARQNADT